jgi:predicted secreted acid phosphatase
MPRSAGPVLIVLALLALLAVAAPAPAATIRTSWSPDRIRAYVDSGRYERAIARRYDAARRSLKAQLARGVRRPAVVLDIDETALSNIGCLDAVDFDLSGVTTCVVQGRSTVIRPARAFVALARRRGVKVVFVTGAPEPLEASRAQNLRRAGFRGPFEVVGRPTTDRRDSVVPYKRSARRALQARGYRILVNVGDQRSDLDGAHARRRIKLPNPIYVTS